MRLGKASGELLRRRCAENIFRARRSSPFVGDEPRVDRQRRDHLVESSVVGGAGGQQPVDVAGEEGVEHLAVVFVQPRALGVFDVHHHLDGFGDVPSGFEHVDEAEHPRRPGQAHVEDAALAVVGLRIVLGHGIFEELIGVGDVRALGVGRADDGSRQRCGLQCLTDDVHFGELAGGQLRDGVADVGLMRDEPSPVSVFRLSLMGMGLTPKSSATSLTGIGVPGGTAPSRMTRRSSSTMPCWENPGPVHRERQRPGGVAAGRHRFILPRFRCQCATQPHSTIDMSLMECHGGRDPPGSPGSTRHDRHPHRDDGRRHAECRHRHVLPARQLRTGGRRAHRIRPDGRGLDPARARRLVPAQRPQPAQGRPGTGSSATA